MRFGLYQEGTAMKMNRDTAAYYQSMYTLSILSEAMWRMYWKAFQSQSDDSNDWLAAVTEIIRGLHESDDLAWKKNMLVKAYTRITEMESALQQYAISLQNEPMAVFWMTFLEMSSILHRSIYHQRDGNWMGHLQESASMLPLVLTSARHYKYGQQIPPLYIKRLGVLVGLHQKHTRLL